VFALVGASKFSHYNPNYFERNISSEMNVHRVGKTFSQNDAIARTRIQNGKSKYHFEATRQFARHTRAATAANYECFMKVFNRTVENRVEKHPSKSKSLARKGLCALCTIVVQLFRRREIFAGTVI
jgi:hypothetical protein